MALVSNRDLVLLGGVAVVGVLLYRKFLKSPLESAANAAADAYVWLTGDGPMELVAAFVMPDGRLLSANAVALRSDATFDYAGKRYRVTGRRSDGNYTVVPA